MDRRRFSGSASAFALTGAGAALMRTEPVHAQDGKPGVRAVLELFTSQGCSSCPAADAMFEQYTTRNDVVALTLPVDYWDYLGWRDTLANAKFTKRQRAYAKQRGDGQIYTPQLVVNGGSHTNGADARGVEAMMNKAMAAPRHWAGLKVNADNRHVVVDVASSADVTTEKMTATVWVASLSRRVDVAVKRGENAGKMLTYFNVVRDVQAIGTWSGDALTMRVAREALGQRGEDACAILVQTGMAGPIIGATMLSRL